MIEFTLDEYLNLISYKVSEGGDFGWNCFGPNAYFYSREYIDEDISVTVFFDTIDRIVYMLDIRTMDGKYVWINSHYTVVYHNEYVANQKQIGFEINNFEDFSERTTEFRELLKNILLKEK